MNATGPTLYPYEIKHRFSGVTLYTAQIEFAPDRPESLRLGAAIKAAYLARAKLAWANLAWANLDGAYLAWANLDGANLDGAKLAWANLAWANLDGANLAGAYLAGANLDGAYLAWANLAGANLAGANLDGANLAGANLAGANLARANLDGANLDGAKHGEQTIRRIVQGPSRADGYAFTLFCFEDGTELVRAGCQTRSLASYREHLNDYTSDAKRAATALILDYLEAASKAEAWS